MRLYWVRASKTMGKWNFAGSLFAAGFALTAVASGQDFEDVWQTAAVPSTRLVKVLSLVGRDPMTRTHLDALASQLRVPARWEARGGVGDVLLAPADQAERLLRSVLQDRRLRGTYLSLHVFTLEDDFFTMQRGSIHLERLPTADEVATWSEAMRSNWELLARSSHFANWIARPSEHVEFGAWPRQVERRIGPSFEGLDVFVAFSRREDNVQLVRRFQVIEGRVHDLGWISAMPGPYFERRPISNTIDEGELKFVP